MKAVIIGNSGSGKTWLSRQLATEETTVVHLDELFWLPGGFDQKRSKEEVDQLIAQSKLHDKWIAEGVFGELAEQFFDQASVLIWLDLPWSICRSRLIRRGSESKRHLGRIQSEEGLANLLEWAGHYSVRTDLRSHCGHKELFGNFKGQRVYLKSQDEVLAYLESAQ